MFRLSWIIFIVMKVMIAALSWFSIGFLQLVPAFGESALQFVVVLLSVLVFCKSVWGGAK